MGPDGDLGLSPSLEQACTRSPRRGLARRGAIAILALTGALAVLLAPIELCFFAVAFRLPCPGCGMTRAALALARGDVAHAVALNPLALVIAPWLAWLTATHVAVYVRAGELAPRRTWHPAETALASLTLTLLVALWGARFFGFFGGPVPV